jgi:hypothetical protein
MKNEKLKMQNAKLKSNALQFCIPDFPHKLAVIVIKSWREVRDFPSIFSN